MEPNGTSAQLLAVRLFEASLCTAELIACYLGARLGFYESLASGGPATCGQLASRAATAPRYTQEWLEQQAASGFLEVDDICKSSQDRLYALPPQYVEGFTQPDSPFYVVPLTFLPVGGLAAVLPQLLAAFRSGEGISHELYGDDFRCGAVNRSVFLHQFSSWVATYLPDVHRRLSVNGARIGDLACGVGWSSVALARAYPGARVDAFDRDAVVVAEATEKFRSCGVADRVAITVLDGAMLPAGSEYDAIFILDALHDMAQPVDILSACQRALARRGSLILMEPNAAEKFEAPADKVERFLYAISLLYCLPVGLSEQPSVGTGALLRPSTLRAYAVEAGFLEFTPIKIENRFYRLYRLGKGE